MNSFKKQQIDEQEQHLDEINEIAKRLKEQGKEINHELDKQGHLIEELDGDIDGATKKLNFVQNKLGKLLKTNDMGQICTIVVLFLILVVMIFLVIYT
jgi:uncharacterized coiled-coil DUF342 family protein